MMSKSISDCGSIALRAMTAYFKSGNQKLFRVNALLDDASTKTYVSECANMPMLLLNWVFKAILNE